MILGFIMVKSLVDELIQSFGSECFEMSRMKAAFGIDGIIGILWIIVGVIFLIYQPLTAATLDLGFSLIGLILVVIGILSMLKVMGALQK
jgi:hypothetical protein